MQKWEYKLLAWSFKNSYATSFWVYSIEGLDGKNRHGLNADERIAELGREGWELVSTEILTETKNTGALIDKKMIFTFKRPLQE